ncbi:TATA element modulatory factor [Geodia barretti]|uniref:TATA element modulatory factor n=1 Tax=Geodia barretti TaxID=519541 RepID=A0AA35TSZ3_GEOBA|nr:TATA element modulatory factor [Geodia barretti]
MGYAHSPLLPATPPPPSPTKTSPLPPTSPVLEPTNTSDTKLAEEIVSLPQQQTLEAAQLSTNDGSDVMGQSREAQDQQESRSVDVKPVENEGGQLKEGSRDSGVLVSSGNSGAVETLQQELGRVNKLLEARETRMVEMSREVIQLSETNQELQSRLSAAEQDLHTSQGGVEELRSEFTKRIGTTEKKLHTIVKERDSLKKQLQVLTTEQSQQRRSASQELSLLLKEKEEQISGLMDEGEKLSKKELQNSNIIKKLKEKNKQNDQLLVAQRQQIEDCEREVGRLKELVKKKEDNEKKYQESMSQLNSIAEQQEKELTALKTERDELTDKARSLQTNLDNAYKELSELHKVTAVNKSVAHDAVLSAEQTARQELTESLEKQRVEHHREKEQLLLEISELRACVSRCEQQSAWREERMKQEVSDVQQRLQEAEMRNQELTTTISQTTKPFLRQIETLRSAHSAQTANWEKVEADMTHRLVEAQTQLSAAVEKERSATEKALTLQSRITHLERQTASQRQEISRLAASLELERAKAETLEESQQRESAKMEAMRSSMQQSVEELRREKEMLERQLEYERVRLEAESRKACLESQEKERLRSQLASSLSRGLSRQSSTASTTHTQSEILEKSLVQQLSEDARGGSASDSGTGFYHGRIPPTSASAIEQLRSLLKQKEGELANAQTLVGSLERSRAAMANDLAAASSQNVDLVEKVEAIPHLKNKLQELQKNNEALLQMYGEKAEKAEELRLDIVDLKEMYKQQIDALTQR